MKKVIIVSVLAVSMLMMLAACGQQKNVALADVVTGIKEAMTESMKEAGMPEDRFEDGKLPGMMEVDLMAEDETMTERLEINKEDIEEGAAILAMRNIRSDEIIVLKAKDESKVEELKAALEKEHERQMKQWEWYLTDQYEKVQNAVIKTNGRYLLYAVFDEPEKIEDAFDTVLE